MEDNAPADEQDAMAAVAELSVKFMRYVASLEERVAELERERAA